MPRLITDHTGPNRRPSNTTQALFERAYRKYAEALDSHEYGQARAWSRLVDGYVRRIVRERRASVVPSTFEDWLQYTDAELARFDAIVGLASATSESR